MNFSEDILQQIEDYLNGTMTKAQTFAFETQIKENADLAKALGINKKMRLQYSDEEWDFVKDYKNRKKINELEVLLKSNELQDKKKAIQNAGDLYFNKVKPENEIRRNKSLPFLAIAASIVLLIGYFTFFNNDLTNQEIYAQHNSWEELPSLVSRSETNSSLLSNGESAFINKDYKLAEEHFNAYVSNKKEVNINALLYLGVSQLELENYNSALKSFQKIIDSNTLDQSKGYWYKALVYLKMDDEKNTINTLNSIVKDSKNFNFVKAEKLLKELN
ncbi:tetratricopeptide repeat protein [Lacinutrix mariniflava]|uniref:tetratricopeptide repeat protein n=1 Tax=Lacinutrix mariniflava TaxID=342955 RepID=UPI0006E414FA|nr:tetratricopeptide repeat protein [Lacinutrix mariniflava]